VEILTKENGGQPAQQMCNRLTAVAEMLTATRGRQPAIYILFSSPISLLISQFAPRHFDIEVHRRVKGRQFGENIAKHNGEMTTQGNDNDNGRNSIKSASTSAGLNKLGI
jgi:hypothetical protein